MATFELEDWVEVSQQVNKRSVLWQDGNEVFCGKICKVIDLGDDPDTGRTFLQLIHKGKKAWFNSDSVIKSTKYDEKRQEWWAQKGKELQEWEEHKKRSTDDALRQVFGLKKPSSDTEGFFSDPSNYLDGYEDDEDTDVSEDASDNWEETTDPSFSIPAMKPMINYNNTANNIKSGLSVLTDEELEELLASISGLLPEEQD